jgi:multidrug efflux pump subunit AcrA (membrane-fusion protein)
MMLVILLFLSACTATARQTPIPTVSLDSGATPNRDQTSDANAVSASAFIVPQKKAELSFASVGRVKAVDVEVGDPVKAGQVQVKYLQRVGTDEVHLQSAQAEADRAQALLDSANATLAAQSTLVAPFDGTVVAVDVSAGETVVPGRVVITMGDLSRFRVETKDLSERDIPRVQIGQSARVFIEALNEEFSGKVTDISRVSSTVGGDVVFKVTVDLDRQPEGLLWGMSGDVTIETGA